jgi:subtilase family serine protease
VKAQTRARNHFPRLVPVRKFRVSSRGALVALCVSVVALAIPLTAGSATAADARVVVAGLSPVRTSDPVVNKAITTSFDLALTQRHQAALRAYIASLSNTGSANYHHYLTPAQYAQRFGAPAAAVSALRTYLRGFRLRVTSLSAGHDVMRVVGATPDIARAFDAPLETVRLNNGALDAHFTTTATLPEALAKDVSAVAGLDTVAPLTTDLVVNHDVASVATATTCPAAGSSTTTTPNSVGGYTVQQQAALYGLSTAWAAGDTGVGQTIGIYELATYDTSDANTYFSCYGLSPTVTSLSVDGGPTTADNANNAPDEATLDVEESAALAPGAKLEVYQGTNNASGPTDIYTQMASDDTATIITTSWGICEAQTDGAAQAEQTIFQEMAAQGQTVVAAAGDDGSSDCEDTTSPSSALAVDDPASQPYVTGVGGLSVTNTSPLTQSAWNDNCTQSDCGAGGGGESSLWSRPSWQVAPGINVATETRRMVPDLAVMGDPATGFIQYYTGAGSGFCHHSCSGGWGAIGGTSIGAPLVSALIAVAAQACDAPSGRLGFVNPSLYSMATTGFVDVTTGNNDLYDVANYSAGAGYDMASGLGSPDGANFLAGLCSPGISASESSFAESSAVGTAKTAGVTLTATLRSASGSVLPNAQVNVSATAAGGLLSINNVYDQSAGAGSASSTVRSNAAGVVTVTVGSSVAQSVAVTLSYAGATIYSTTLTFDAAAALTRPGAPAIVTLAPLVGGFTLVLRAPASSGGSAITAYQYSINGGRTWAALAKGKKTIKVTRLAKRRAYSVTARALNAQGASVASHARRVVTRL